MSLWNRFFRNRPEARKSDLDDEIAAHIAMAAADREAAGADPATARREARREFGNTALVKDITRETWGWLWLEHLFADLKYSLRQIRKSPGFALTAIGTLALGIGAAAAMFTVVDHVLLRPLPYVAPDRLVTLDEAGSKGKTGFGVPWLDLRQWAQQSRSVEKVAFFSSMSPRDFLLGKTVSIPIQGKLVSANLFDLLGVRPKLGHGFDDDSSGTTANEKRPNTIVLSDAAWQMAYNRDPAILGKVVKVNNDSFTVVGVMPPDFTFPFNAVQFVPQVWASLQLGPSDAGRTDDTPDYSVIARLRSGAKLSAAAAELSTIQQQVIKGYVDPEARQDRAVVAVEPYATTLVDASLKKALLTLLAATGVLWLIACINVTNLLLARATTRRREIAMRGALGASRGRVMQQLAVEGLVLSISAAGLGMAIALAAIRFSRSAIPASLNVNMASHVVNMSSHVDLAILGVLCGLTLLSATFSSVWPALLVARAPIEPALRQGGQQTGASRGQNRLRGLLVVVEIAMSLTLLAGCGLLLRTIYTLRHVPLGFRTDHILVADLSIPSWRYTGSNMTTSLYKPLLERAQHLPGVQAAGLMTEVPLGNTFNVMLSLRPDDSGNNSQLPVSGNFKSVSPGIRDVFGFRMLAGRFFDNTDTPTSQPVFVVNRAFAQLHAPDHANPASIVGSHLWRFGNRAATIIGIIDDERQNSMTTPSQPEIEASIPQLAPDVSFYKVLEGNAMDIAVRTSLPPEKIIPGLRSILRKASPEFAGVPIRTMDQIVEDSYGSQRLAAHLLEIFGGSALLLCIAGLYGLLAYIVSQRTREMGVRIALGAQRGNVLWLVLRQAGGMVITGIVIGMLLALAGGRFVRSYLYGVSTHDAWTLSLVALLLLLSGMLAAYLPARRAAGVNPVEALRAE